MKLLDLSERYASVSCVKQSIPLAAVISFGQLSVSSGSTRAISGTKLSCLSDLLNPFFPIREITAFFVASLPVPEVVGIAIKGSFVPGCSLFPTPSRNSVTDSDSTSLQKLLFLHQEHFLRLYQLQDQNLHP